MHKKQRSTNSWIYVYICTNFNVKLTLSYYFFCVNYFLNSILQISKIKFSEESCGPIQFLETNYTEAFAHIWLNANVIIMSGCEEARQKLVYIPFISSVLQV